MFAIWNSCWEASIRRSAEHTAQINWAKGYTCHNLFHYTLSSVETLPLLGRLVSLADTVAQRVIALVLSSFSEPPKDIPKPKITPQPHSCVTQTTTTTTTALALSPPRCTDIMDYGFIDTFQVIGQHLVEFILEFQNHLKEDSPYYGNRMADFFSLALTCKSFHQLVCHFWHILEWDATLFNQQLSGQFRRFWILSYQEIEWRSDPRNRTTIGSHSWALSYPQLSHRTQWSLRAVTPTGCETGETGKYRMLHDVGFF